MGARKIVMAFLALVVALALTSPLVASSQEHASEAPDRSDWPSRLVIAYPLIGTRAQTLLRHASLNAHLADTLGLEIAPVATHGYLPIYVGFRTGKMDVAYMGPLSYIELCGHASVEPAVMEVGPSGQAGYHALLITNQDSGVKSLEQGRGKTLAMVRRPSTSGFLIPTWHFLYTLKTSPREYAQALIFTETHDEIMKGVAEGRFDVGASNDVDLERACNEQGFSRERFRVLWKSELYPGSPYAIRTALPPSLRAAYREAMLAVNDQPEIKSDLGIAGFEPVKDSAYDPVRKLQTIISK